MQITEREESGRGNSGVISANLNSRGTSPSPALAGVNSTSKQHTHAPSSAP